jgi:hypothetical protein
MRSAGGRSVLLARHPLQAVPATLHAFGLHANNSGNGVGVGGDGGTTQNARAAALADPVGGGLGLAIGGDDRDVAAEADDEIELQLFGQQPVELAVTEAAVGHEADLDPDGQRLGQADQRLVLVAVAAVLQGRRLNTQPEQRRGPAMPAEQREHQRGLTVGGELSPVHCHGDCRPLADHMADPERQQGVDVNPRVGQQAVDLLDGMPGFQAARQCQALADQ